MMVGSANAALSQLQLSYNLDYTGIISGTGFNTEEVYLTAFSAKQIGGDPLSSVGYADTFTTFCMDISQTMIPMNWWESGSLATAGVGNAVPYQPGGIFRAASLYNAYVSSVNFTTTAGIQEGAALQLAIWNVLYNSNPTVFGGAGFQVTSADPTVTSLADAMVGSAFNNATPGFTATFWNATDANGNSIANQDLIGPLVIPEPATYCTLAGVGLLLVSLCSKLRCKRGHSEILPKPWPH